MAKVICVNSAERDVPESIKRQFGPGAIYVRAEVPVVSQMAIDLLRGEPGVNAVFVPRRLLETVYVAPGSVPVLTTSLNGGVAAILNRVAPVTTPI